ncbi:hypothetical protein [Bacillus tequilensis]|uniref:hypothetical protein n=1 Tax=Bacillus tequilensis TaxID=227866 RepID=UPI0020C5B816|nr:hypothetical protein [Bacillus tequilensis]
MTKVANTKLETVRKNLKPKFEMNSRQEELNDVYSALLYSYEGKAQKALVQRISESAQLIVYAENDGKSFVNSFKTRKKATFNYQSHSIKMITNS